MGLIDNLIKIKTLDSHTDDSRYPVLGGPAPPGYSSNLTRRGAAL
ncbi:hypothetical protein BN1183_CJ_01630 [Pantoea ananatis]|nr:hypothetical protein BN1183_CJ_01630 [Pantoea ananatis]